MCNFRNEYGYGLNADILLNLLRFQVARLGLNQLVELGITLVGHQKKINTSIQAIRAQLSVNVSEGFLV